MQEADKQESWVARDNDKNYIPCIGIDGKQHICYPWETKCYCGTPIKRKNSFVMIIRDFLAILVHIKRS